MDQESVAETQNESGTQTESQQDNGTVGKVEDLPSWAQSLVKELRTEAAANRKAKKEAESAAQAAKEKELEEQQAWQKLAQERQAKLTELEKAVADSQVLTEKVSKYESMLKANLDAQMKSLPDVFKPLLAKLDLTEQMEWLSANADKLNISALPAAPKASGQMSEANKEEARERQKQFTISNF